MDEQDKSDLSPAPDAPPTPPVGNSAPNIDGIKAPDIKSPEQPLAPMTSYNSSQLPKLTRKSKKPLIVLVILLLAAAAFGGWYFYMREDDAPVVNNVVNDTQPTDQEELVAEELITTTFTAIDGSTASVEHPKSWQVENKESEDPENLLKSTYITSAKGHVFRLFETSGIGGACEPNTIAYKLEKVIDTQTPGVTFREYVIEDSPPVLSMESTDAGRTAEHNALKEGESHSDLCTNSVGYYSVHGAVFVSINKEKNEFFGSTVPYSELLEDPEFLTMLESLLITKKT